METLIGNVLKWNSKRLVAIGAAGYAVYALAIASLLNPIVAGGLITGLALGYVAAETFVPSEAPKKKKKDDTP